MSDFDRIKPPEKRLLERRESRSPDSDVPDPAGRAGLFSIAEQPTTPGAGVKGPPPRSGPGRKPPPRRSAPTGRAAGGDAAGAEDDASMGQEEGGPHVEAVGRLDDAAQQPVREARASGSSGGASNALLRVSCDRCGQTSGVDPATALRSAIPLVLIAPWRSHPLFATCPACNRRAWLRPALGPLG